MHPLLRLTLLLFLSSAGLGQNTAFYTDRALGVNPFTPGTNGTPSPVFISYGQVRVCNIPSSGDSPCSNPASISDIFGNPLSIQGGNFGQLTTDVVGRFSFACTTGNYLIQVAATGSNTPSLSYPITCPADLSLLITDNSWSGIQTFVGPVTFSNTVTFNGVATFNQGIIAPFFSSNTVNPASAGTIRLASADTICWRNFANNANVCISKNSSDIFSLPTLLNLSLVEGSAPAAAAGKDVCYGDSTLHNIECAFNNGAFTPLVFPTNVYNWAAYQSFAGILMTGDIRSPVLTTETGSNSDLDGTLAFAAATTSATYTFSTGSTHTCVITPISDPGTTRLWVSSSGATLQLTASASITISVNYFCGNRASY